VLRTLQHPSGFTHQAGDSATRSAAEQGALLRPAGRPAQRRDRRSAYEADLIAFEGAAAEMAAPDLDVPSSKELGGLLLLWEGGQPLGQLSKQPRRSLQASQDAGLGQAPAKPISPCWSVCSCRQGLVRSARISGTSRRRLLSCSKGCSSYQTMGQAPEASDASSTATSHALLPFRVLDFAQPRLAASMASGRTALA